jgi:signal transduction histidine kinase
LQVKVRTWPILALGFGALVLLTVLLGVDAWRRANQINRTIVSIHDSQARAEEALREIETGIYLSSIFARDFLLDPSQLTADSHRQELRTIRSAMDVRVATLNNLPLGTDRSLLHQLSDEIDAYWDSLDPIFDWTPVQKMALSSLFLRQQVLPRRTAVLDMAREVKLLNEANLGERRLEMDRKMAEFKQSGERELIMVVLLAVVVAAASIVRLSKLETRAEQHRAQTEHAEQELRRLSQQLVRAQEDERRNISRELHDEVGQILTALRVELGNLEKLRLGSDKEFREHLDDAKGLAAQSLQSVRNLAAGLRPSILDDLGLGPALEWQAREFSRRTGIPVEVQRDGLPPELPDRHRTCLYRVVQEALTNCARHAEAREIRIALETDADYLSLTVQDNGRGLGGRSPLNHENSTGGLGLMGIEERVRELGGTLAIRSQPGKGTLLNASIPLPKGVEN